MSRYYNPSCEYINEHGDCSEVWKPGYWYNEAQGCCPDEEEDPWDYRDDPYEEEPWDEDFTDDDYRDDF